MQIPEKPSFHTETRWVDRPTMQFWMESCNNNNRAPSTAEVRRWVDRFNLGRYQCTHQGMAFDEDGQMIDGQTRGEAFLKSNLDGFWIQVTTNMPRSTFDVIDVGRARAAGHLIPGPFSNTKAGAARWMLEYPRLSYPSGKVDTEVILDVYDAHRDSIDLATEVTNQVYRATGISHSGHAALIAVVLSSEGAPAGRVDDWIDGLTTGAGLEVGDPRLALRNRWALEQGSINNSGKHGKHAGMFYLTRAWNAYVHGEQMTKLQLPRGGRVNNDTLPEVVR